MKKSDLISGKHIVELRDGSRLLVAGDYLPDIDGNGFMWLMSYTEDLKYISSNKIEAEYDICKVYQILLNMSLPDLANRMDTACKLVWERKPELSEAERVILENVDKEYRYIAREGNNNLYLYSRKPNKFRKAWASNIPTFTAMYQFNHLFRMVKWEDEEPTLIADLLEGSKQQ